MQRCPVCDDVRFRFRIGGIGCFRCHLHRQVDELVQAADPDCAAQLSGFLAALVSTTHPSSGLEWLSRNNEGHRLFIEMLAGHSPVTHDTLDEAAGRRLGRATSVEYLRKLLVDARVLPARNEDLSRLERSIAFRLVDTPALDVSILRQYTTWVLLAEVRRRIAAGRPSSPVVQTANRSLATAEAFLAAMRSQQVPASRITQSVVDGWLADRQHQRNALAKFLTWTSRHGWTPPLGLHKEPSHNPGLFNAADRQFALARQLVHTDEVDTQDRLAGCLVLLFGQTITRICRLTAADVATSGGQTTLKLGTTGLVLPEPLGTIARDLAGQTIHDLPRAGVATSLAVTDMWLYPGRPPTRPLSPARLRRRLEPLGITGAKAARNSALMSLARDVPAAVLADLLGLDRGTAERWRDVAAGRWVGYAELT